MTGRQVLLDSVSGRPAAALLVDGLLDDLLLAPPDDRPVPGAIYRARVNRQMKGQGGVFLDMGDATGFLRQAKGLTPGETILVQVTSHAEPGKAAPVTPRVLFKSRFAIVTADAPGLNVSRAIRDEARRAELQALAADIADLPEGAGLILRSAAEGAEDGAVIEDIAAMQDVAAKILGDGGGPGLMLDGPDPHFLAWREWASPDVLTSDPGCFDRDGITEMIDALRRPRVTLQGGGSAWIEPTRALVAVDVNTGNDSSQAAGLKANIALARRLPAELRCRGLGGQIVLDLAPMPKKERKSFEQVLGKAFRACPVETSLVGFTQMGLYELQRKRERLPLSESLTEAP